MYTLDNKPSQYKIKFDEEEENFKKITPSSAKTSKKNSTSSNNNPLLHPSGYNKNVKHEEEVDPEPTVFKKLEKNSDIKMKKPPIEKKQPVQPYNNNVNNTNYNDQLYLNQRGRDSIKAKNSTVNRQVIKDVDKE